MSGDKEKDLAVAMKEKGVVVPTASVLAVSRHRCGGGRGVHDRGRRVRDGAGGATPRVGLHRREESWRYHVPCWLKETDEDTSVFHAWYVHGCIKSSKILVGEELHQEAHRLDVGCCDVRTQPWKLELGVASVGGGRKKFSYTKMLNVVYR
jgi:hypothetical protein